MRLPAYYHVQSRGKGLTREPEGAKPTEVMPLLPATFRSASLTYPPAVGESCCSLTSIDPDAGQFTCTHTWTCFDGLWYRPIRVHTMQVV